MKSTNDIPALRRLWKQCFDADTAFLDLFFGKGFSLCSTYVLEEDSEIVSALSVMPIRYHGHLGGYIYGVCTSPRHRGHRYAISLLQQVEEHCRRHEGMDFFILRPASGGLFDYYRRQGYTHNIFRNRRTVDLPTVPEDTCPCTLTGLALHKIRRDYYYDSGLFEWSPTLCDYILEYIKYCKGAAFSLHGTYLLGYPNPDNPEQFICEEAGISEESLPLLLSAIRQLFPSCTKALFNIVQSNAKEEFMLCKTFGDFIEGNPLFSFTME